MPKLKKTLLGETEPFPEIKTEEVLNEAAGDEVSETLPEEMAEPEENPDLYTIQAADLNAYPELSQQGIQLYQQVLYLSLTVNKWATGEKTSTVQEPWPRQVASIKRGITFKG